MDGRPPHERIVPSMSAVTTELPLSPELVLVSPPEVANLARRLLEHPVQTAGPTAAATRATSTLGAALFSAFCAANCLVPFAVAAVAAT
jgi:hypothetical protein